MNVRRHRDGTFTLKCDATELRKLSSALSCHAAYPPDYPDQDSAAREWHRRDCEASALAAGTLWNFADCANHGVAETVEVRVS